MKTSSILSEGNQLETLSKPGSHTNKITESPVEITTLSNLISAYVPDFFCALMYAKGITVSVSNAMISITHLQYVAGTSEICDSVSIPKNAITVNTTVETRSVMSDVDSVLALCLSSLKNLKKAVSIP